MNGLVKFTDLSTSGSTTINGANITTGSISADRISGGTITATKIDIPQEDTYWNCKLRTQIGMVGGDKAPFIRFLASSGSSSLEAGRINLQTFLIRNNEITKAGIGFTSDDVITINANDYLSLYGKNNLMLESGGQITSNTIRATSVTASSKLPVYIGGAGKLGIDGSSRRYKHDIQPICNTELDPHRLYDLRVVQFKFNSDIDDDPSDALYQKDIPGFIAEEVEEAYPVATLYTDGNVQNWDERKILPPMLALIQEQHKEIEELKAKNIELEERLSKIEELLRRS